MKAIFMVLFGNMRRKKLFSAIITLLSVLTSMFLVSAIGIMFRATTIYETSYDRSGEADMFYGFVSAEYIPEYEGYFKTAKEVDKVYWEDSLLGTTHMKEDEDKQTVFSVFDPKERDYNTLPAEFTSLCENEILLPMCFEDDYGLKAGDSFFYEDKEFKIKGFFEDPIYGSPFYESKRVLISKSAWSEMEQNSSYTELKPLKYLHVYLKENYKGEKYIDTIKKLDGEFAGRGHSLFAFDKANLQTVRTIVPRIVLIVLFVFSLFLMSIMSIVIRWTILAAIEDDYASLGIMKALGFKNADLTQILLWQYLSVVILGSLIGILAAYIITPPIGTFLLKTSGIVWTENISPIVAASMTLLLLLFIGILIFLQTYRVKRVKPIEAIVQERQNAKHEKNHFIITSNVPMKLPLSLRMGIKQLSSKLGQYISMLLLITIFSFMILTVISLSNAFGTDEKISGILGYEINDISLEFSKEDPISKKELDKIFEKVDKKYHITYQSSFNDRYKVYSDNTQMRLLINSTFDPSNLLEGRLPKNEKEIMLSSGISKILGKKVGDTVSISLEKDSPAKDYEVVGINNKIHSLGKNISMTDIGFKRLVKDFSPTQYYLKIQNADEVEKAITDIQNNYAKDISGLSVTNERETILKRTQAINAVFRVLSVMIIIISLALVWLITFLVSLVVIKRETYNFGIMKSIGFTAKQIRVQFALRFGLIALSGTGIGMIAYRITGNNLINGLFSVVNIASIPSGTTIMSYVFDFIFILVIAVICAWVVSVKIKLVKVKDLILG